MLFLCCVQYFDSYAVVSLPGTATIYGQSNYEGRVPHKQYYAGIKVRMCHTLIASSMTSTCKNRSNLKIAITCSVVSYSVETNIVIICGSWDIFLTHSSFGFGSVWKIVRGPKPKPFSGIFEIHVLHMIASIWLQMWKLDDKLCKMKPIWPRWYHQWRHSVISNIAFCI